MNENLKAKDFYEYKIKLLNLIQKLPSGKDKLDFLRAIDVMRLLFSQYDSSCVESRVRPSVRNTQITEKKYKAYMNFRDEIATSLTLAILFKT